MDHVFIFSQDQFNLIKTKLEAIEKHLGTSNEALPEWVNAKEAQSILGVGQTTLWQYRQAGLIQAYKISKKLFFKRSDLLQLLASGNIKK
jgi:hypothetical protein